MTKYQAKYNQLRKAVEKLLVKLESTDDDSYMEAWNPKEEKWEEHQPDPCLAEITEIKAIISDKPASRIHHPSPPRNNPPKVV